MGASSGGGDSGNFNDRAGLGSSSITSRKQTPLSQDRLNREDFSSQGGSGPIGGGGGSFASGSAGTMYGAKDSIISRKQTALPGSSLAKSSGTGAGADDAVISRTTKNVTGGKVNGVGGGSGLGEIDSSPTLKLTPFGLLLTPSTSQLPNPQVSANDPQDRSGGGTDGGDVSNVAKPPIPVPQEQTSDDEQSPLGGRVDTPVERTPRRQLNLSLAEVSRKTLLGA